MKKFFLLFASVLLIAAFISLAVANSKKPETPKFSTTVTLEIAADEEVIKNQVYSYISRELRSLGDVQLLEDNSNWIVEGNSDWIIQVIAMQQKNKAGRIIGVVMSSVILKPILRDRPFQMLMLGIAPKLAELDEKLRQIVFEELRTSCIVYDHEIRCGSSEDLQSNCKDIVADFDSECLKESRKTDQQLRKLFNKWREELSAKKKDNEPKDD